MSIRYHQYYKKEQNSLCPLPPCAPFQQSLILFLVKRRPNSTKSVLTWHDSKVRGLKMNISLLERPSFLINRPITQLLTVLNFFYEVLSQSRVNCLFLKVNVRNIRKDEMFLCLRFSRFCFFSLFLFALRASINRRMLLAVVTPWK